MRISKPTPPAHTALVGAVLAVTIATTSCSAPNTSPTEPATPSPTVEVPTPPTTPPTTAPTAPTTPVEPPLDEVVFEGTYTLSVGPAGTITVDVAPDNITLHSTALNQGWSIHDFDEDGNEFDIEIRSDSSTITFEIEVEDRQFDTDLTLRGPAPDAPQTYPLGGAGSITVEVDDRRLTATTVSVADDWTARGHDIRGNSRTINIELRHNTTRQSVTFEAATRGDDLIVEIATRTQAIRISHQN
ncbi:hypothetical protein IEU95_09355 [Hoyosella rhizosphaerae]|uniref:Uncharacterized protein n=1 Tax=Hoyosella rhizosphaerae TaxID=1755582 RepID=A0A916U0I2_9ACTN|nr:hypothetical protein [Hoyosella rhizosphaerae]MBN4927039.1 hypothetical protein [Hoyosella rhizosphaerae]GGC54518.1 hypothetical protein GCM10011410_03630 [Hoyosella rhizosphaerae]